jgi:hypothetical protein
MRLTIDHRKHVATVAAAAAMALSLVLLVLAAVGSAATPDTYTPPATAANEAGVVNPWAAGDAAALNELADMGRAHLDACP